MSVPSKPQKRCRSIDGPTAAEQKWRRVIEKWRQSGLDATAFCRDRGLPVSALGFWKREIPHREQRRQARRAATEASRNAMRLLPVRVVEPVSTGAGHGSIEVILAGGRILRLGGDFDPAILRQLIAMLEEIR
ncbi:MAG: hypothetical protein HYY16_12625 [Planctomycetes bacterium]|nr:hypothetical protein [Planctomycetota bacterium]